MKRVIRFAATLVLFLSIVTIAGDVGAGGTLGDRFVIHNDAGVQEDTPAVAYNSQRQEYLVVWQEAEIWAHRVRPDGTFIGTAFRVSPSGQGSTPDVAYDSTNDAYLVVWRFDRNVQGQRISASGAPQGGVIDIAMGSSQTPAFTYDQPAVDYASTAERYVVAFRYSTDSDGSTGVLVQSVETNGALDGGHLQVSQQSSVLLPEQPDLAYLRSQNEFLVVWHDLRGSDTDIYGRRVRMTGGIGTQGAEFWIGNSLENETDPAVAAIPISGSGQYLVAWESYDGSDWDVYGRTVAWDGVVGSWRTLADTPWSEYTVAVVGCESNRQFLVTWVWVPVITPPAMMQIQARTLALDGTPLHETVYVGGGQVWGQVVAAGPHGDHLIAFDDNETFGTSSRGIYGVRWGNRVFLPLILRQ